MAYQPIQFFNTNVATTGDVVLYTVPTGKRIIVTDWIFGVTAGQGAPYAYVGGQPLIYNSPLPASNPYATHFKGFWVASEGETLVYATFSNPGSAWQSGHGLIGDMSDKIMGGTPFRAALRPAGTAQYGVLGPLGANNTAVIKQISESNYTGSNQRTCTRIISVTHLTPYLGVLAPWETRHYDMTTVIKGGQQVTVQSYDAANSVQFHIHGILL